MSGSLLIAFQFKHKHCLSFAFFPIDIGEFLSDAPVCLTPADDRSVKRIAHIAVTYPCVFKAFAALTLRLVAFFRHSCKAEIVYSLV